MEDSQIVYPPTPVSEVTEPSSAMEEDGERPTLARSLSDEYMDMPELKLTDFEVRGMLGMSLSSPVSTVSYVM